MITTNSELEQSKLNIIERFFLKDKVKYFFNYIRSNDLLEASTFHNKIKGLFSEIEEDLSDFFKLYGLSLNLILRPTKIFHETWWYECDPINSEDLDIYVPLFLFEFSLYPVTFVRRLELKSIYFSGDINISTDSYSQNRDAIPDYSEDVMAMIYSCKVRSVKDIKNIIHHELFHFYDYIEDGVLYGPDYEWEKYNTPGFFYRSGGVNHREWKALDPAFKGFLNFYSTTGIEEDKAEIFSFIMINPDYYSLVNCEIIINKIKYIINNLEKFDPEGFGIKNTWEQLVKIRK